MSVHIEVVGQGLNGGLIVSVAHYFEQEGDLCCDPDMTFLMADDFVFPLTFQQAIPPVYHEAVRMGNGEVLMNAQLQEQITEFADQWMANIDEQQLS